MDLESEESLYHIFLTNVLGVGIWKTTTNKTKEDFGPETRPWSQIRRKAWKEALSLSIKPLP